MNKKSKVIVCGITFGQFYCEALRTLSEQFEFAGIFANGSERSVRRAEKYSVPLFTCVEELDEDIDIACVAVRAAVLGGTGTELALELLKKGIHVIQEQPVHYKEIETCIKTARENHVKYMVGDLYKNLPAVKTFINAAKKLQEKLKPLYLDAGAASQVTFPLIEILADSMPGTRPFQIKNVDRGSGPFHIITAEIGNVPAILQIHNEVNPEEPDNYMHYLHRVTIGTENGRLCLEDTQGPVRWHNKMHIPLEHDLRDYFQGKWPEELQVPCNLQITEIPEQSFGETLKTAWIEAICMDLLFFKGLLNETPSKTNLYHARLVANARIWHELTERLGFPELTKAAAKPIPLDIAAIISR